MQSFSAIPETVPCRQHVVRFPAGKPLILQEGDLELRLASNRADTREAQKLRFDVFHRELRLGHPSSRVTEQDQDAYDGHCDHLLVIDTSKDCLVGTYRLLSFDRVPSFGFYSETEFDLTNVKRSGLRLLELGRSCVAQEYRDGKVIRLLFRGIAEYLRRCGADALMGCASVYGTDAMELSSIRQMLSDRHLSEPDLRVTPRRGFDMPLLPAATPIDDAAAFRALPPLFKGYLRLGAKVCGPPAYDRQFGTTDYLVLARTADIEGRYGRRFLA